MAFFRLIRITNLLMIALTQYLAVFCIIKPVMISYVTSSCIVHFMNEIDFFLLVLSSVLIAAAGYIINDYYDIEADKVNRPDKIVIGNKISAQFALILYWFFNIVGILIGFYLADKLHIYKLGLLNLVVAITLWFYSANFKKQVITGNIVIAILSALVIITVWLFEFFALSSDTEMIKGMLYIFNNVIIPYSLFAFFISFIREAIKDIEDIEGDSKMSCNTFPVVYGIKSTKILLYVSISITIVVLTFVLYNIYVRNFMLIFWYLLITVELPLFYMIYKLFKAENKESFSFLSGMTKIIMLAGILSMQAFNI